MTDFEDKQVANNETMEDAMNSVQEVSVGDIVKGEVLAIEDKQVVVGIEGAGVEGVVPAKELSTLVWEEIEQDFQAGKVIEAPVTNVVKGGLVVDVGVRGFVPASMVEDHFVADFSEYKGQTLAFKIIEIEPSENRLILSHKAVVEAEKESKKEELLSSLHDGDVVEGKVARLTDFGAFIDLGGVDGLVHVSEIAHQHVGKVKSVEKDSERISLSIKETLPGPWTDIETKAAAGTVLDGTVKRLTSFGAFVEVFPGVEGLVHISQISHKHIATPHEVLHEGDQVQVKVLEVNPEEHRIALSIKALEPKPESQEEPKEEQEYELPEENTGFTMGDILGDALSDAKEEE